MTDKERDIIFIKTESILKSYLPHSYSEPEYVNDMATELTEWCMEHIENQLKEYQESLFKSGMVVMKDGKVVKLEDFFIKENQNEEK